MKLSIEKKTADSSGCQQLLLTRHYGSHINEHGKRVKRRKRQSLNLFIYALPKDKSQRDHNKKALTLAEKIRAQAIIDLANNKHHFEDVEKQQQGFLEYIQSIIDEKQHTDSKSNISIWVSASIHFRRFTNGIEVTFEDISPELLLNFRTYLTTKARTKSNAKLSINTASAYFNKIRATLNQAFKEGIIRRNPVVEVKGIKLENNPRNYLEEEEIRTLFHTECQNEVLKRAFLFSCITGMRWSDIQKLTWSDITLNDQNQRAVFKHKKTKNLQYLDLPDDSLRLMGTPSKKPQERVFKGLKYSSYANVAITKWMLNAGILKHITFHSARHTFAVRMLTNDVDIYTVSKLLGHSELKTTQIYADIIERKRKDAMNSLPQLFGSATAGR